MSLQQRYDEASARYEAASAEYERLNEIATVSPDEATVASAAEAYEIATHAYRELTDAHLALEADDVADSASIADASPQSPVEIDPAPEFTAFDASPLPPSERAPVPSADGGIVLRRGTTVRLVPQTESGATPGVTLTRNLLQPTAQDRKAEITRNRKIAGNLPEWSPLPPGEIPTLGLRRRA